SLPESWKSQRCPSLSVPMSATVSPATGFVIRPWTSAVVSCLQVVLVTFAPPPFAVPCVPVCAPPPLPPPLLPEQAVAHASTAANATANRAYLMDSPSNVREPYAGR